MKRLIIKKNLECKLHQAIKAKDTDTVRTLLSKGADANFPFPQAPSFPFETPLLLAIKTKDVEIIKLIIERLNKEHDWFLDAMFQALKQGSLKALELLIKNGANINVVDEEENTLLHTLFACMPDNFSKILEYLIKNTINISALNLDHQ